jgi:large subunit ribosomal protein L21
MVGALKPAGQHGPVKSAQRQASPAPASLRLSASGRALKRRELSVYAIVRCGGRQERASVDDVLTVDLLSGEVGSSVKLATLLVVDGSKVISDPAELGDYEVTAEIVGPASGPKINMIQYKNKTGYRRRLGHRQKYTQVRVTGIGAQKASTSKASASSRKKG